MCQYFSYSLYTLQITTDKFPPKETINSLNLADTHEASFFPIDRGVRSVMAMIADHQTVDQSLCRFPSDQTPHVSG